MLYGVAARVPRARTLAEAEPPLASVAPAAPLDAGAAPVADPVTEQQTDDEVAEVPPTTVSGRILTSLVSGALLLAAALRFGAVPALAPYCVLFCALVTLSVTDLRVTLVPRRILYPFAALVVAGLLGASAADGNWHDLWVAAACGAVGFALFFIVWYLVPRGMGFGDVRLAGLIALALGWLGPLHVYLGFLLAFLVGTVMGAVVLVAQRTGRKTRIPFGPALSAGAVIAVLWGGPLIDAWIGHGS